MVAVSYIVHYDTLLQNATDVITKCDSYFILNPKEVYYKMRQFYYKMRHLLQNASFITKCFGSLNKQNIPELKF